MKAYLISSSRDAIVGMRLAGVEGCYVGNRQEAEYALMDAGADKENAILFITEKAADLVPDIIEQIRENSNLPFVVEIPDRHGSVRDKDYLAKYVQEIIGVKMQ